MTYHPGPKCGWFCRLRAAILFAIGDVLEIVSRMFGRLPTTVTSAFSEYYEWACDDTPLCPPFDENDEAWVWTCPNWMLGLSCSLTLGLFVASIMWLVTRAKGNH